MIKYILLDLGGVVFNSSGISNNKIDWSIILNLNHKYGHQLNIGEDLFGVFMKEYNQLSNQNLKGDDFLKLVFDTLEFNHELVNFLKEKYPIIIISDNYRKNIEYISQRYHFARWAVQQYYSFDFKLEKKDDDFFKLLLEKIKVEPEEVIFIDDSDYKIASAQGYGIKGILYKNAKQVKEEFLKLGL